MNTSLLLIAVASVAAELASGQTNELASEQPDRYGAAHEAASLGGQRQRGLAMSMPEAAGSAKALKETSMGSAKAEKEPRRPPPSRRRLFSPRRSRSIPSQVT